MDSDISQGHLTTPTTAVTAPQIRSRITVVCAECKRLKLKCDRRNPCGSCQKRDTVARCIYSPAAAEKVDLHSLNNRLIQVEATLAQLTSGQFMPSYPFSAPSNPPSGPPPSSLSLNVSLGTPTMQHSSLAIPLEEIGGTWLNEIDLGFSLPSNFLHNAFRESSGGNVKVEPHTTEPLSLSGDSDDFDMADRPSTSSSSSSSSVNHASSFSPNIASLTLSSTNGHALLPPSSIYYGSSAASAKPQLTARIIALLPSLNSHPQQSSFGTLMKLAEESTTYTYPFLSWKTLRERGLELLNNARPNTSSPASNPWDKELSREKEKGKEWEKKERETAQARQLFGLGGSGSPRGRPVFGIPDSNVEDPRSQFHSEFGVGEELGERPSASKRTGDIPLFATLCAAMALGALEESRRASKAKDDAQKPQNKSIDATFWYSLSAQAIEVWDSAVAHAPIAESRGGFELQESEKEARKTKEEHLQEMDYISACLLQLTFLAKDGFGSGATGVVGEGSAANSGHGSPGLSRKPKSRSPKGVGAVMFPLVGKLVNYARQMSLNKDPEDLGSLSASESSSSPSPSSASSCGLPSGAKKAKSNSKLTDPSALANLSTSRGARESRFTLYEAEIRRRIWWTIMYYDLFVSDIMNQPPLIADNTFNTKRPVANVDEKVFGPISIRIPPPVNGGEDGSGYCKDGMRYFEIRSRLTLLVRSIKRRMNTPEFGHAPQVRTSYYGSSPNSNCYSIDQAASMETEIRAWLNDLPPYYQLDHEAIQAGENEPALIAQRCEVAITAHRLILRVYLPFLKKHAAGVPHQASLGSINAAHGIMKAGKALLELWKWQENGSIPSHLSPALFDFYPFPRAVFDAAVVCAHAVIKQPSTMWAATAMEDVDIALEIMKNVVDSKFGSAAGALYVINSKDCARIVEALKHRAESGNGASRKGGRSASPNVPSKRKHNELDEMNRSPVNPVPAYVYPTIPSALSASQEPTPTTTPVVSQSLASAAVIQPAKRHLPFPPPVNSSEKSKHETSSMTTSPKGNDKDKKQKKPYPAVGVRKRPTKDGSPLVQSPATTQPPTAVSTPVQSRRQSVSAVGAVANMNGEKHSARSLFPLAPQAQSQSQASPATSNPSLPFHSPTIPQLQAAAAQGQFSYRSRSSSLSQDPRLHVQRPRRDSTLSTATSADYPMASYEEQQSMDVASPQTVSGPSISSRQHSHNLQQAYVDSPTSYDATPEVGAYEFPFNQTQGAGAVDSFNNASFATSPSSSPYGTAGSSSNGGNGSSPRYATPTFGPQSSSSHPHQPSPPSFSQTQKQNHSPPQQHPHLSPQEFYNNPGAGMFDGYDTSGASGGIHGDMVNVQSVISGVMEDPMIFDTVSYDVKPSMEELQRQQHQTNSYGGYNPHPQGAGDPHSHHSAAGTQVWTTLGAQHQHENNPYWGDPAANAPAHEVQYYHQP